MSRISGMPKRVSRPGAFEVPADLDLRALARSLAPPEETAEALLAIRSGRAPSLRRRGRPATTDLVLPSGFDVYAIGYSNAWTLAEEAARYAADVLVLEPVELRQLVLRGLRAVAGQRTAEPDEQLATTSGAKP